jgi:hypothetical protein
MKWQKDNSKEQARLLGVKNKQDALAVLADPSLSEDWKNAWIKLNTDAGFLTEAEGKDWISKNLVSIAPEEEPKELDYTSILGTQAVNLILKSQNQLAVTEQQFQQQATNAIWSVTKPDGTTGLLKGSDILDKNNPQSPVYAFKDLPGYQQIQPIMKRPSRVVFTFNGKEYDTFAKASEQFQLNELQKG